MKYNSIFQYERNSMVCERLYQKGVNLPFRMFKNEIVFKQFKVENLELLKDGSILYHLTNRHNDGSNFHLMNPEEQGFKLITQKDFKEVNLMSSPPRKLDFEKILSPNLLAV